MTDLWCRDDFVVPAHPMSFCRRHIGLSKILSSNGKLSRQLFPSSHHQASPTTSAGQSRFWTSVNEEQRTACENSQTDHRGNPMTVEIEDATVLNINALYGWRLFSFPSLTAFSIQLQIPLMISQRSLIVSCPTPELLFLANPAEC